MFCDSWSVGKTERIWGAADFPTLPYLALQQHRAAARDSCLSSHHMQIPGVLHVVHGPDILEPCHPMPFEISSFSEKSRVVSVVLFYFSSFVGSKMENTAFSSVSVTIC